MGPTQNKKSLRTGLIGKICERMSFFLFDNVCIVQVTDPPPATSYGGGISRRKAKRAHPFRFCTHGESSSGQSCAMVINYDATKYCFLEPFRAADGAACTVALLRWCSFLGAKFMNEVISDMKRGLGANHHPTTERCRWLNGTVELSDLCESFCDAPEYLSMRGDYNRPTGVLSFRLCETHS